MSVETGASRGDGQSLTSERDAKQTRTDAEIWLLKIHRQRDLEDDWREEATEAIAIYEAGDDAVSFNLFHSNVETLLPSLYNSTPVPDMRRRFGDADPVAKMVVDIGERAVSYTIDQFNLDREIKAVIKDGEVAGRGVLKLCYKPSFEGDSYEKLANQVLEAERVPWDRIVIGPAKSWAKVPWIAEELHLTEEEVRQLSPKHWKDVPLDYDDSHDDGNARKAGTSDASDESGVFKTAKVWRIWDRKKKRLIHVAEGFKNSSLKNVPDPLGLPDFFPYLEPYQPIMRISKPLVPVNPYKVYMKLLDELDVCTQRINKLMRALKVRGLVDASIKAELERLQTLGDGEYLPVQNAAQFLTGSGKGLESAIHHMPLDQLIAGLAQLYIQREQIKQTIYEVTGLSDIMRGATDAKETLGAQQIKTQWGSLRIQNRQAMVAQLPRLLFRQMVTMFGLHYEPERLAMMTSLPAKKDDPQEMALFQQAIQIMQSPELTSYRVDIETNSTIRADLTRMQEQMNMFMGMTGQFLTGVQPMVQMMPQAIPLFMEVYTAVARNFKLGKQAEDALDQAQAMMPQVVQQLQQQGQQDPAAQKAAADAKMAQEKHGLEMQAAQAKHTREIEKMDRDAQHQAQLQAIEFEMKKLDAEVAELKATIEVDSKDHELEVKKHANVVDLTAHRAKARQELSHGEEKHGQATRHAEGSAAQKARHAEGEAKQGARHKEGEAAQDARHADAETAQGLVHADAEAKQKVAHQGAQAAIKTASSAATADIKEKRETDAAKAAKDKSNAANGKADKGAAKKKRSKVITLQKNAEGDVVGATVRGDDGDEVEIRIA